MQHRRDIAAGEIANAVSAQARETNAANMAAFESMDETLKVAAAAENHNEESIHDEARELWDKTRGLEGERRHYTNQTSMRIADFKEFIAGEKKTLNADAEYLSKNHVKNTMKELELVQYAVIGLENQAKK